MLKTEQVEYGKTPENTGETPTKKATAKYTYAFKGWSPEIKSVTGDATYKATFSATINKYTITWKNGDEVLKTEQVEYGKTPEYTGETPAKASTVQYGYTFKEWSPKLTEVTENATYTAVFDSKRIGVAVNRISGKDRFETTAKISKAGFETADTVVLAYSQNYSDALAGVPLAQKLNAPLLLTDKGTLSDTTLTEIKRLGAKKVVILGGTNAIGADVEKVLKSEGISTQRISGRTRFSTATAIAEQVNESPTELFFVYGYDFADALSVSSVAAIKNAPIIYLTEDGELNTETAEYLSKVKGKVTNAYVIGGSGVISDDMVSKAAAALGLAQVTRISGSDRYETCVEVNKAFADVFTSDEICVATGADFPDALAGGVFAARKKAPLFLASGELSEAQRALLKDKAPMTLNIFGGSRAVSNELVDAIATACI